MENKNETLVGEVIKIALITYLVGVIGINFMGCMQITGAKRIKLGTWEIESNAGFEVSAGAMQFDGADNQKTMNRNK